MMTADRWSLGRKVLLGIAGLSFLLSMPCIVLGLFGLVGIVADVGAAENRQIGLGLLRLAILPLGLGTVTLVIALSFGVPV